MSNERRTITISVQVGDRKQEAVLSVPVYTKTALPTRRMIDMVHARAITLFYLALNEVETDIATDPDIWAHYNPEPQEREA